MEHGNSISVDNANAFKRLVNHVVDPLQLGEICNEFLDKPMLFFGVCIQPTSTADVLSDGFFIRIVSESDLRPSAIVWDAWIEGVFLGYCNLIDLCF